MLDKKIFEIIKKENERQHTQIELIASENYVSEEVLKATGSILTNKYAEGYPSARYYNGCEYIDEIEKLAIDRLKRLFNVKFANVQPHSGSQANAAVFFALLKPGDKVLGMSLDSGGHLTHGYKITFSGRHYDSISYEVDENGLIDFDEVEKISIKEKPKLIICGYSAYSRTIDFKRFKKIADKVGAYLMADIAHIAGIVAMGEHPSPVGIADVITSTTHKTLRGARGGVIMTNDETIAKKIDRAVFPGLQGGPLMHSIAGKAVAFYEALQPGFKNYIKEVVANAKTMANTFIEKGVTIVSGGTDNHMFTIDVKKSYDITGKDAADLLHKNNITANKNTVPQDPLGPRVASGVRIGTAAMTTFGFSNKDFENLALAIHDLLSGAKNNIKEEVRNIIKP